MAKREDADLLGLARRLDITAEFLADCVEYSAICLVATEERVDLRDDDVLRLRRLQRVCGAFDVDACIGSMLLDMADRIAELERDIRRRRPA
ncbi:MAG: chaperone modulator CbpM [Elusimicrobiota bacterium]